MERGWCCHAWCRSHPLFRFAPHNCVQRANNCGQQCGGLPTFPFCTPQLRAASQQLWATMWRALSPNSRFSQLPTLDFQTSQLQTPQAAFPLNQAPTSRPPNSVMGWPPCFPALMHYILLSQPGRGLVFVFSPRAGNRRPRSTWPNSSPGRYPRCLTLHSLTGISPSDL